MYPTSTNQRPAVVCHEGIMVVRDDLLAGGTKARVFTKLYQHHEAIIYASPAEGGAQTALATAAAATGKRAIIFTAQRKVQHPRAHMAKQLGAEVHTITPGYLSVVQHRARQYAQATGAYLLPFGAAIADAETIIGKAALATGLQPQQVWCASGSGTLSRALQRAWPDAEHHVVQIGCYPKAGKAIIHRYPRPFASKAKTQPPFPSDWHYDAKAWEILRSINCSHRSHTVVFWNVAGPPEAYANPHSP